MRSIYFLIFITIFSFKAFSGTVKLPELSGDIHNFNQSKEDFKLRLKISCIAKKFSLGSPWTSCGEKVFEAKIENKDGRVSYKFPKNRFKYKVGFGRTFNSLRLDLYINESLYYYSGNELNSLSLNEFIDGKKIVWKDLQDHIKDLSLYMIESKNMNLLLKNGESAISYLKSVYGKKDTLYMGARYQLLYPHERHNYWDADSYCFFPEGKYYATRFIEEDAVIATKTWLFAGIVDHIKVKFTSFVTLQKNEIDKDIPLRHIEQEVVYPNNDNSLPEFVQKVIVDESWNQ